MSILKGIKINSTAAREFIFFLLLTALVAGLIKLSKTYDTNYKLAVQVIDVPLDKTIRKISPNEVSVNVKNTGFSLLHNKVDEPRLNLSFEEMTRISLGAYTYNIKDHLTEIKATLDGEIINTSPEKLSILIDSMASKRVPVKIDLDISYAPGYGSKGALRIQPDSVTVVGPTALLDKTYSVQVQSLRLEKVSSPIKEKAFIGRVDTSEVLKYSATAFEVTQDVTKFTEGSVTVAVKILNDEAGAVKILPKTVEIIYTVDINDFDKVAPSDFLVTCDYQGVVATDNYLSLSITRQPEIVSSARLVDKQVQFIVVN